MKITILAVGKIKEKFYTEAVNEFAKRLSKYCKLEIIEVKDEKTKENASEVEENLVKKTEADRILEKIPEFSKVIALAIEGKELD